MGNIDNSAAVTAVDNLKRYVQDCFSKCTGKGSAFNGVQKLANLGTAIDGVTQDANATAGDILTGSTAYAGGEKIAGTMPYIGDFASDISSVNQEVNIPMGYHDGNGGISIAGPEQSKIIPSNIKAGVSILGVTGILPSESGVDLSNDTVTPQTLLKGVTAHDASGALIEGELDMQDYIVEKGEDANWMWEKWDSGKAVAWSKVNVSSGTLTMNQSSYGYYYSNPVTLNLPQIFIDKTSTQESVEMYSDQGHNFVKIATNQGVTSNTIKYRVVKLQNNTATVSFKVMVIHRWK